MVSPNSDLMQYAVIDRYTPLGARQIVFKFDNGFASSYVTDGRFPSIMLLRHKGNLYATVDANLDEFDRFGIASPIHDDDVEALLRVVQGLHPDRSYIYKTPYEPFDP